MRLSDRVLGELDAFLMSDVTDQSSQNYSVVLIRFNISRRQHLWRQCVALERILSSRSCASIAKQMGGRSMRKRLLALKVKQCLAVPISKD